MTFGGNSAGMSALTSGGLHAAGFSTGAPLNTFGASATSGASAAASSIASQVPFACQ
jgi:hypothetical protein